MFNAGIADRRWTTYQIPRQTSPLGSGAGDPENPIANKAVVAGVASIRDADCQDEPLKERSFLIQHQVSCQAGLHRRYQLEPPVTATVNPFCQHGLAELPTIHVDPLNRDQRCGRFALVLGCLQDLHTGEARPQSGFLISHGAVR